MKKLFLVIGLMTSVIFCNAQSTYEPEFIGETNCCVYQEVIQYPWLWIKKMLRLNPRLVLPYI